MNTRPPTKLSTLESIEYLRLMAIIRRVRFRWRLKVALQGLALLLAAGLLTLGLAAWGVDLFRARPWVVGALSLLTYGCLAWYLYRFVACPLLRRTPDGEIALYIEKRAPALRAALVSAVEFGEPGRRQALRSVSPRFVEKVVEQALAKGPEIDFGKGVEREGLRRVSGYLGAASTAVLAILLINPAFLRQGLPLLLSPWGRAGGEATYGVGVTPGDAEVARGGDQLVTARLQGFDSDRVEISTKVGDGEWERLPMNAGQEGEYSFMFLRLADSAEYFVEASGVRSPVYRLDVVDVPYVERIEMQLDYPEYSGLEAETILDGGDIAALPGTRARLRVLPTVQVPGGRLRLELIGAAGESRQETIPLEPDGDALVGTLVVETPGYYEVELEDFGGAFAEASSEYVIDALDDQPPVVRIDKPGRDTQVTSIEEVFTEVSAEDDYGLGRVDLVYSVNGGDEQVLSLLSGNGVGSRDMTGSHTFYLEEWELQPGDLVSYYARAADVRGDAEPAERATDIYFMTVRPFGREYRQAPQGGGGGGGGGGPQFELSRRQREILAATFKIRRDRGDRVDEQTTEDLDLLESMQSDLRGRTVDASQQVGNLGSDNAMEGMRALSRAADEMDAAVERLGEEDTEGALGPEQRALQHLQRFEALFKDMMVSLGGGGEGSGGDMSQLENLFQIDPEELSNQYEAVQRERQQQADNDVDEALQRLTELARRQQQEIERQRAQARTPSRAGSGGGSQRQIAQEAEDLARQLERLSRQRSNEQLQQAANRLRDAADAMRRSAASGQDRAMSESARALNEMQNARRLLDRERGDRLQRDLADAQERVERLQAAQRSMERQVGELGAAGARTPERMDRILEGKDRIAGEIRDLEHQLDEMARASRSDQLQTSRGLQEAAEHIRDSKLADKVRYSKGVVQERDPAYARRFEEDISKDLADLGDMVEDAAGRLERPEGERLAGALEETRDLVRRLESFEERAREAAESPAGDGQPDERAGERQGAAGTRGEQGEQQEGGRGQATGSRSGGLGGSDDGAPGPRQLAREFQERISDAEALRESLRLQGVQTTDLDGVIAAMHGLDENFQGSARGLDELRADVIDDLKLFEFWLRRVTDAAAGQRPRLTGSDAVPDGYRELVEEYFRSLARQDDGRR